MTQPKKNFLLAAFFIFCLSLTASFAQTPINKQSEPSFDVILQTVIASNNAGDKSDVTAPLSSIVKKLKADFPFTNYRLTSTSIQRIGDKGGAYSKSVSYVTDKNLAVFSEWVIDDLESSIDDRGQESASIRSFKFNQRIPILSLNNNYEQLGLTAKFSVMKNTPTVVGSLTTAEPAELMFLILTVKSSEK
jgi:hypothetical protein